MEGREFTRERLYEDLADAVDKTARACVELEGSSQEARRCASHVIYLGPCHLRFGCPQAELRRLFFALKDQEARGDFEARPTAEFVARLALALQPREALVELRLIASGELADLRNRGALDTEDPFGVQVRGEAAAEAERTLAWLLVQAGLPAAEAAERMAA